MGRLARSIWLPRLDWARRCRCRCPTILRLPHLRPRCGLRQTSFAVRIQLEALSGHEKAVRDGTVGSFYMAAPAGFEPATK